MLQSAPSSDEGQLLCTRPTPSALLVLPSAQVAHAGACSRGRSPSSQSEGSLKLLEVIVGLRDHHPDGILQEGAVMLMNG